MVKLALNIFALSVALSGSAAAQAPAKGVHVFGEETETIHSKCFFEYKSAVSAVEAALRYNRIAISEDLVGGVVGYINVTPLLITKEGESDSRYCAYSYNLEFKTYQSSVNPLSGKASSAPILWCHRGGILIWNKYEGQMQLNTKFKAFVDECLSEMQV